jgi:hypothetical protein
MTSASTSIPMNIINNMLLAYLSSTNTAFIESNWVKFIDDLSTHDKLEKIEELYTLYLKDNMVYKIKLN